ncbi:protein IQ-DOMAIN 21-like [Rutidosis leptorrhynchoides]|uniref:protein IQ-DOMAIN 21-like n=1 Tax=Rutidosis leptorrhynchoides TaxID=125765 RepID=UPI003A99F6E3
MAKTRRWFGIVRRKILRSPPRHSETIIVLHTNNTTFSQEQIPSASIASSAPPPAPPVTSTTIIIATNIDDHVSCVDVSSINESVAATKIQTSFRRHLAQRAYKALRSLVRLQALVRGAYVRKQSRIALDCMHTLARLQVVVRAHQLHLLTSNTSSCSPV